MEFALTICLGQISVKASALCKYCLIDNADGDVGNKNAESKATT
jgi:hypothetical protein